MTSMAPGAGDGLDRVAATARWTAAERARESAREDRLFEDPLAGALAGDQGRALAERTRGHEMGDRPWFAVRTRFYDDALGDSLSAPEGPSQVVAVAAGMDTRPYRLALPSDLTWYELDRPELLAVKDGILTERGAVPRCGRRPVGVDLTAGWADPLTAAGFDPALPTVWLAEGLLFYLEPAAVHRLLDQITALSAPDSELLTDTIGRSLLDHPDMREWCDWLAEQGTPWLFGTDRPEDDLFTPRGWQAAVWLYTEIGSRFGRWPHPTVPRDTPDMPQSFLMHATR